MVHITPIRGFVNTPVLKVACVLLTLSALALSVFKFKYVVALSIDPFILQYRQYWRIATFQLAVVNESDYFLCVLLWFHFKVLERFFGSRKYMSLVVVFAVYCAVGVFLTMSLGQLALNFVVYVFKSVTKLGGDYVYQTSFLNRVSPGPLPILAALYVCYGAYIPVSYHFKVVLLNPVRTFQTVSSGAEEADSATTPASGGTDITLTSHFPIHVLFMLLLLNNGVASIVPCAVGLVAGKLYTQTLLPGAETWMIPQFLFQFIVRPKYALHRARTRLRATVSGYSPLAQRQSSEEPDTAAEDTNEERIQPIDDMTNNNDNEIRAETPVRPLARQFLDTFRSST